MQNDESDSLISTICVVIEFKHDYYKWCLLYLIQSNEIYYYFFFCPYAVSKKLEMKEKLIKRKGETWNVQISWIQCHSPAGSKTKPSCVSVVWSAAPCPGDKHKAVNSWSASGHRHPENDSLKNCREELSLFPCDVRSKLPVHFSEWQ